MFERALSSVGLHVTKGLAIWEAYREFESAIMEAARVSARSLTQTCKKYYFETNVQQSNSPSTFASLLRDGL